MRRIFPIRSQMESAVQEYEISYSELKTNLFQANSDLYVIALNTYFILKNKFIATFPAS